MRKVSITLPLHYVTEWRDVDAVLVDVAPHLASVLSFAIHENPIDSGRIGNWTVSNVETGLHIETGETIPQTLRLAVAFLSDKTPYMARYALRKWKKKVEAIS